MCKAWLLLLPGYRLPHDTSVATYAEKTFVSLRLLLCDPHRSYQYSLRRFLHADAPARAPEDCDACAPCSVAPARSTTAPPEPGRAPPRHRRSPDQASEGRAAPDPRA